MHSFTRSRRQHKRKPSAHAAPKRASLAAPDLLRPPAPAYAPRPSSFRHAAANQQQNALLARRRAQEAPYFPPPNSPRKDSPHQQQQQPDGGDSSARDAQQQQAHADEEEEEEERALQAQQLIYFKPNFAAVERGTHCQMEYRNRIRVRILKFEEFEKIETALKSGTLQYYRRGF